MSKSKNYKVIKQIGEGSFGEVYLVQKINTNELYVSKKINLLTLSLDDGYKYLKSEETILKLLDHKNIVHLYEYFEENNFAYFIMEYCNGGSLADYLKNYKKRYKNPLTQKLIQFFAKQILEGLSYIHSKGIIHRDLKLENILLNFKNKNLYDYRDAEIKIIDFGLSSLGPSYSFVGTPNYMDPKILKKFNEAGGIDKLNKYDEKADIWSLGAICYEMLTGEDLWKADDLQDLLAKEEKGIYFLPLSYNLSFEIISFLNAMLQYKPEQRATAKELLNYPFLNKNLNEFTNFDFSKISYKIKDGFLIIDFIHNDTITNLFNPELALKIDLKQVSKVINRKNDVNYEKELNNLLNEYYKAKTYFKNNDLKTQEEDANQKIMILRKMQENLVLGIPIDLKNKPKKITPEYIYGCSFEERKEKFNLIINSYKQQREKYKNSDTNKLKEIDYMIYNLESIYQNKWTPPPKYRYEEQSIIPPSIGNNYQVKIIVKRLDNIKVNYNFTTFLVVNPNTTLKQNIEYKPDKYLINEWIWQINETDWENIYNNNLFTLNFEFGKGDKEKNNKLFYNITKEKLGKPCSFNINRHVSNYQIIIINFILQFIRNKKTKSLNDEKNIICEKIYPSFEGIDFKPKSSIF